MKEKELVWVTKDQAERFNAVTNDENRYSAFEDYLKQVSDETRREFKANFENLEEDVAIYTGLMLKVKQAFEKAKNEQLNASYVMWEQFEKEIPSIRQKTASILEELEPLETKLKNINELMGKIRTWEMDKVIETVEKLSSLYGNQKEMIEFLVRNFKPKAEAN